MIKKFTEYFVPKRNIIYERCLFHEMAQKATETIEVFVRELQSNVSKCDPGSMIRDRFVIGLSSKEETPADPDLTLDRAVTLAGQEELVKLQLGLQQQNHVEVNEAKTPSWKKRQGYPRRKPAQQTNNKNQMCNRCGYERHGNIAKCPATGQTCKLCKKKNHFTSVCCSFKNNKQQSSTSQRKAEEVSATPTEREDFFLGTVQCPDGNKCLEPP